MAKRRKKSVEEAAAPEPEKDEGEKYSYRVLTANAIFGPEVEEEDEEEDGTRIVAMTEECAKRHTDADVRLERIEE